VPLEARHLNEWGFAAAAKSWWNHEIGQHPEWKLTACSAGASVPRSRQRSDRFLEGRKGPVPCADLSRPQDTPRDPGGWLGSARGSPIRHPPDLDSPLVHGAGTVHTLVSRIEVPILAAPAHLRSLFMIALVSPCRFTSFARLGLLPLAIAATQLTCTSEDTIAPRQRGAPQLGSGAANAATLLTNPGFESGGLGWQSTALTGRTVVGTPVHSGVGAQQTTVSKIYVRNVFQDAPVTGGTSLDAAAWVSTSGIGGTGATVSLLWLNAAGLPEGLPPGALLGTDVLGTVSGTQGWTQLVGTFTTPANTVVARFQLKTAADPDGVGTAWFDDSDLTLSAVGPPDTTLPSVTITAPVNGALLSGRVTVDASASDNIGVIGVQFQLDGGNLGTEDTSSPFSASLDASALANGNHVLTASARDLAGNTAVSAGVTVSINNTPLQNALSDPGFEGGGTGWQRTASAGRSVVTTAAHSGVRSQQSTVHKTYERVVYQDVPVTGGASLDAAAWVSTSGIGGAGTTVSLLWLNAAGLPEGLPPGALLGTDVLGTVKGTQGWTQLMGTTTAPVNAVVVRLQLKTAADPDGVGTAWFDDTQIQLGSPPPSVGPSTVGGWSPVMSWPVVAIHSHVLPNGKVLTWGRIPQGAPAEWNPADGTFQAMPLAANIFCSGHALLPDGRLLVTGGHIADNTGLPDTYIFDFNTGAWTQAPMMALGRWYPTSTTLPNGEVLTVAGSDQQSTNNVVPEVFQTNGTWRRLTGAPLSQPYYPFMFVAPDGRAFEAGPNQATHFLTTSATGAWSNGPSSSFGTRPYGSAVMYDAGKILLVGGGDPPTSTAEVIDLSGAATWRSTNPLPVPRRQLNATLLADGTVLVTGGTSSPGFNGAAGAQLSAQLWNPTTEVWTAMASMTVKRLYHSSAVLLPDGRVLSAGSGQPAATGEVDRYDAEIYSPNYLFQSDGSPAVRPVISASPTAVGYGQTMLVTSPDAASITKVTWIRLSSVTHAFNQNQRMNYLSFTNQGNDLLISSPANPNLAPPGHYLLFILNASGVPSDGQIVRIN